ncbi:MAG TPA: c-type cytochrome [Pyrinomonadaceae bacterium]|nr:c-type cytochrome [Pyrinomonadaceae bacterium]
MADAPETDAIVKKEPDKPVRDPIVSRSTSGILFICAMLLTGTLAWALYDEAYGQRAWKGMQQEFVKRYNRYLRRQLSRSRQGGPGTEKEVKESEEYQTLDREAKEAAQSVEGRRKEIDNQLAIIQSRLDAITDPYQNARGYITVLNYKIETSSSDSTKNSLRQDVVKERDQQATIEMPAEDGSKRMERVKMNYTQMEALYTELKDKKAALLLEKAELLKKPTELAKKRDDYLKENVTGLTDDQIRSLIRRNENFDYSLRQISVLQYDIVDRCETCHLGVREPVTLTPTAMAAARKKPDALAHASVSHPSKELLQIHNPERFGCSSCHGGNGRATTSVEKGHGRHKFWLHPLWARENMEAGCQQCHSQDRVLQFAPTLTEGKDLFQNRGCVGCHRYEGFDRETDALSNARQTIKQLEEEISNNERESRLAKDESGNAENDTEAQRLLARAESLRVTNSLIAARIEQLNTTSKYLMQDQKKVGPNLKDVRLKLRKEWIPEWLRDPQNFRPGTKMPTFWRIDGHNNQHGDQADPREDEERKAIAAFIWQESFDGRVPERQKGNAVHGKELFETRGCMACHSIGERDQQVGGDFAANLSRVGEKASYDYIVRWIYNPRERWAPYCPKEKRDLTREDYEKNGKPFVFDQDHSKCPNDGAEIQVQNMTVMPNFRLAEKDAEDIATYLFSLSNQRSWPDASFMDDPKLKDTGRALARQYGCANCHEIKGLEDEQRIGKELSAEGATPIERFDFALLTKPAEEGLDPFTMKPIKDEKTGEERPWYNAHGFISNKIKEPSIYDKGKEKEPKDQLRMPRPFMTEEWNRALTTFLIGSVGVEGANVPQSLFYHATDRQRDIQDGWWVIKKYNCMGCHSIQVGQNSVLMGLPLYQSSEWRDQLPPRLTSEGARVDPDWLLRFLHDPSLSDERGRAAPGRSDKTVGPGPQNAATNNQYAASQSGTSSSPPATGPGARQNGGGAQGGGAAGQNGGTASGSSANTANADHARLKPQPGQDRNGVRPYLKARMPTFSFSPQELRTLVRFFMAVSAQQDPYIPEKLEPLTEQEKNLARQLFTSRGAPCLKCHITGDPEHDKTALAPNFLLASERLKPGWTFRWILDPQQISPGTGMPSGLFKKDGERWVFSGETPPAFNEFHGDHADLLVRYMFELTADEQRRLASTSPPATSGGSPAPKETESAAPAQQGVSRAAPAWRGRSRRRIGGSAVSYMSPTGRAPTPLDMNVVAVAHRRAVNFSP